MDIEVAWRFNRQGIGLFLVKDFGELMELLRGWNLKKPYKVEEINKLIEDHILNCFTVWYYNLFNHIGTFIWIQSKSWFTGEIYQGEKGLIYCPWGIHLFDGLRD